MLLKQKYKKQRAKKNHRSMARFIFGLAQGSVLGFMLFDIVNDKI
jgi:hypothetical protein